MAMPTAIRILLWVLAILILVYLLWFLYGLISLQSFTRSMKRKLKVTGVLFAGKRDVLLSLFGLCKKQGAEIDSDEADLATRARWTSFEIKRAEQAARADLDLRRFEKLIMGFVKERPEISKLKEYGILKESLDDLNLNYRRIVANYDSDLIGYDYWRRHPLFRYLFLLFGFRERKRLV
jgi:hypothetical protein